MKYTGLDLYTNEPLYVVFYRRFLTTNTEEHIVYIKNGVNYIAYGKTSIFEIKKILTKIIKACLKER